MKKIVLCKGCKKKKVCREVRSHDLQGVDFMGRTKVKAFFAFFESMPLNINIGTSAKSLPTKTCFHHMKKNFCARFYSYIFTGARFLIMNRYHLIYRIWPSQIPNLHTGPSNSWASRRKRCCCLAFSMFNVLAFHRTCWTQESLRFCKTWHVPNAKKDTWTPGRQCFIYIIQNAPSDGPSVF